MITFEEQIGKLIHGFISSHKIKMLSCGHQLGLLDRVRKETTLSEICRKTRYGQDGVDSWLNLAKLFGVIIYDGNTIRPSNLDGIEDQNGLTLLKNITDNYKGYGSIREYIKTGIINPPELLTLEADMLTKANPFFADLIKGFMFNKIVALGNEFDIFSRLDSLERLNFNKKGLDYFLNKCRELGITTDNNQLGEHLDKVLIGEFSYETIVGHVNYIIGVSHDFEDHFTHIREGKLVDPKERSSEYINSVGLSSICTYNFIAQVMLPEILGVDKDSHFELVEIGSGSGKGMITIAKQYPNVKITGYEICPKSCEVANKNIIDTGLNDRLRIEKAEGKERAEKCDADLMYMTMVIHELKGDVKNFFEFYKPVLKSDGKVLVIESIKEESDDPIAKIIMGSVQFEERLQGDSFMEPEVAKNYICTSFKDVRRLDTSKFSLVHAHTGTNE